MTHARQNRTASVPPPRWRKRAGWWLGAALLALVPVSLGAAEGPCRTVEHLGERYTVCSFDPATHMIDLRLRGPDGAPFGSIAALRRAEPGFEFAMNAGMYRADLSALGLYVEDGGENAALITNDGWGNFHLLPNGVFFVARDEEGAESWHVRETLDFEAAREAGTLGEIVHATQSGPMLVIGGKLHPRFLPQSDSLKVRNGVGVTPDGRAHFAISEDRVRFHDFGTLFRDVIGAPDALFLDGTISTFEAPGARRVGWRGIGPIVTATPREPAGGMEENEAEDAEPEKATDGS